jgi:hypothetical protein
VRTVPIPTWVKAAVDAWTVAAGITHGPVFRAINKAERIWGDGMSPKVLWDVVRAAAVRAGIEKLAPHDLTTTVAGADASIRPGTSPDLSALLDTRPDAGHQAGPSNAVLGASNPRNP